MSVVVFGLVAGFANAQERRDVPTFPSRTELVTVDAVVLDSAGRPARTAASSFVLLVDDMSLAPSRQETVRTALMRFLTDGVRDGDELIYATTSGDAWWTARMPEGARTFWPSQLGLAGEV